VALLSSYAWLTVIGPFIRNGMPPGWDSGAYIGWTNSLSLGGLGYVQNPNFVQFSGLNLVPLLMLFATTSLTGSGLLGYVVFQLLILACFFTSTFILSRSLSNSLHYTALIFSFLVTSFAFIRMTRDLYANLLTIAFLQLALAGLAELKDRPSRRAAVTTYSFATLMLFTDVEIGIFGLIVLAVTPLAALITKRVSKTELRRFFLPIILSAITGAILWLPYASDYLPISSALIAPSGSADSTTLITVIGGLIILPALTIGASYVFFELRENSSLMRPSVLATWFGVSAAFLAISLIVRPTLAVRIALLVPTYFLLPESVRIISKISHNIRRLGYDLRPVGLVAVLLVGTAASAYSVSNLVEQTTASITSPFLSQQNYRTLTGIGSYMKSNQLSGSSTVFLIYPPQRLTLPQAVSAWTNLYDNWIFATVGPHLTYYGTVENFTQHVPINFVSGDERTTFQFYSKLFASQNSGPTVNIMIVSFLYAGNNIELTRLSQPLPGVYLREANLDEARANSWMPSYYAQSQTGGYFALANWSYSGFVLESYSPSPADISKRFQINFSMYLQDPGNYSFDARMYDFRPTNSPIVVTIDGYDRFAINYYGSLAPRIFSSNVGPLAPGYHFVSLQTLDGMPHNIDLDAVRFSNSAEPGRFFLSVLPSNWSVVDGIGSVNAVGKGGSIMVTGTTGPNGILGVRSTFSNQMNFSGSAFLLTSFNSSIAATVSLWVVDSAQNVIRYDLQYYAVDQTQLIVLPILLDHYSFVSTPYPDFSSVVSVEIGVNLPGQVGVEFQFTSLVLVTNPIPVALVS